ncbi:MAG: CHRD domain-containing protein [Desulfuromonadales bacterium]|nr:CHRD domain-containing protein [Desulfuromonadales bacterium]
MTAVPANGDPKAVAVSLANGFPLWYLAGNGARLAQCLDTSAQIAGVGPVDPCELLLVNPQFPPSLSNLANVLYWQAEAAFNYVSSQNGVLVPGGFALLVLALEGAGANEGAVVDGNQAVFSRIRLRIDVPVPGTYQVTHPFGTFTYEIASAGQRSINQTQDVGVTQAQNFLAAMRDRNVDFTNPANLPLNFHPAFDDTGAVVNENGATIGPFLQPTLQFSVEDLLGGPVTAVNGNRYLGLPLAPGFFPLYQPVAGSTFVHDPQGESVPANFFRIELTDPPPGFELNPGAADPQVLQTSDFLVAGKIFNHGANQQPAAPSVKIGVLKGRPAVDIDPFAGFDLNDFDPVSDDLVNGVNVHGIDPQAIALADPATGVFRNLTTGMPLLTQTRTLLSGATVRRFTRSSTGQSLFRYSVPSAAGAGFSDRFHYVLQDTGGLTSAPAAVDVLVEDLRIDQADFRVKTGKWQISGTTDQSEANAVRLYAGPRARMTGAGVVPPVATPLVGTVDLVPLPEVIDYRLIVQGLPQQDNNLEVNLHVDGPGQPVMFRLCSTPNRFIFPFAPACSATGGVLDLTSFLSGFDLLPAASGGGVLNFSDAVDAILAGKAFVNVRTTAHPGGSIRGPLFAPQLGAARVNAEGKWEFRGKAGVIPGLLPSITARSVFGTQTYGAPLRLR